MKKIIWRCDDFGSATGANEAILQLARLGLTINVSVMIVGPAARTGLEELAGLGPHVCLGIHSAMNAEWAELKWGPVGAAARASRMVDASGHFHPNYDILSQLPPKELAAEAEAQVTEALSWGVPFAYLDEHMCYGWIPGVEPLLVDIAARHGLVFNRNLPWVPVPEAKDTGTDLLARLKQGIETTPDDQPHVAVFHPALDDESTRQYVFKKDEPPTAARERQAELNALSSAGWRDLATADGVRLMTYREL